MDKTITTAFLVVAGVISAVTLINAVYPAIVQGGDAITNAERRIGERLKSQIEIIHATQSPTYTDVALVWVKNVGALSIKAVERSDVFFGPEGNFTRIPYGSGTSYWTYEVENDTTWKPTATLKITIDLTYNLVSGQRYFVKIVLPNGISDEYYFSVQ